MEDAANDSNRIKVRDMLGSFLFRGDEVEKKVKVLSGGERNRLALCKMLLSPFNVLILDEPAKNVSRDLQAKTGLIIKELSKKLGIQFIISSHIPEIITGADTVVNVKMVNGISTIESVQDTGE